MDVRRGDGPAEAFDYTMPVIVTTEALLEDAPEKAAAAVRAVMKTQAALKNDPSLASGIGQRLFPPAEAGYIADLIASDAPYYTPSISPTFVQRMMKFAGAAGLSASGAADYDDVVARQTRGLWQS
jgi:ABC-type nitrate/sulfonate/bicarbonate transport system substrate-binding protein